MNSNSGSNTEKSLDSIIGEINKISKRSEFGKFFNENKNERFVAPFVKEGTDGEYILRRIPQSPPASPEEAFLIRRLLFLPGWDDLKLHAQWQNYWLSCCISSKCDYIFAILAKYDGIDKKKTKKEKIDREKDILFLLDPKRDFVKQIPPAGRAYYYNRCNSYLLRRYSWRRAVELWRSSKPRTGFISLWLPRMFGTTVLGIFAIASAVEASSLPLRLYEAHPGWWWGLFAACVLCSLIFLYYEVGKVTEYNPERAGRRASLNHFFQIIFSRAISVYIIGLVEGIVMSASLVWVKRPPTGIFLSFSADPWVNWAFFAVWALFIGIFLQAFWEEKTIAEPL